MPLRRLGGVAAAAAPTPPGPGLPAGTATPAPGTAGTSWGRRRLRGGGRRRGEARGAPRRGAERSGSQRPPLPQPGHGAGRREEPAPAEPPGRLAALRPGAPPCCRCGPTAAEAAGGESGGLRPPAPPAGLAGPRPLPARRGPRARPAAISVGQRPAAVGTRGGRAPSRAGAALELPRGEPVGGQEGFREDVVLGVLRAEGRQGCGAEAGTRRMILGAARELAVPSGSERGLSSVSGDRYAAHPVSRGMARPSPSTVPVAVLAAQHPPDWGQPEQRQTGVWRYHSWCWWRQVLVLALRTGGANSGEKQKSCLYDCSPWLLAFFQPVVHKVWNQVL